LDLSGREILAERGLRDTDVPPDPGEPDTPLGDQASWEALGGTEDVSDFTHGKETL
jgi:hypothetical protein